MSKKFTVGLTLVAVLSLSSVAMANSYASGVVQAGASSSFILNEDGADVRVVYDGGATEVNLGTLNKGTHTFDATLGSSWELVVTKSAAVGWSQISADATSTSFYSPCGVSVNKNAASPNFGKAYISETATNSTSFGRSVTSGIYMLNADASEAGWSNGGVSWTGTSNPFKSTIGPDDHLYMADYSNDLAYEFSADMSTATALIDTSNKTTGQYVEGIHVEGTQAGGNRSIYLVNSHYLDARVGLVKYDLGSNAAATAADTGTQVIGPGYFGFYPRDVARDSNGDWYMNQYRSTAGQAPPLMKFTDGPLPINTAEWEASSSYTGSYCLDINEDTGIIAYGDYYTGFVRLFDMDTGAFIAEFDAGSRIRELAFDAAGNLVTVDNSQEWARIWSPGGDTTMITRSDGTFAIPEPTTLSLLTLGSLGLLRRRRRA